MYEPLRRRTLALLKIPPEPHPPLGDPASLRVFHAGRNYFKLRVASWAVAQSLALAGILFWATILIDVEIMARAQKPPVRSPAPASVPAQPASNPPSPATATATAAPTVPSAGNHPGRLETWKSEFENSVKAAAGTGEAVGKKARRTRRGGGWDGFKQTLVQFALLLPPWAFPLLWALKITSFVAYLVQIPITYAVRRLDYELRWYMVTDRSLRLRHGVWKITESTMSFANLQQVVVSQGPLQRLLGLADVKVQSAGGGGGGRGEEQGKEDMHHGLFHSVTNATEIRDLILDRLRRYRESGLGDPDEKTTHASAPAPVAGSTPADTLAAARELLAEARALRAAL